MTNYENPTSLAFLDWASKNYRDSAEINAGLKLKELQKKDQRFNDPMMAYKALKESQVCPW